jgi:hypothetical protein
VPATCAHEIGHNVGLKHNSDDHGEADGGEWESLMPHGRLDRFGWDFNVPNKLIGIWTVSAPVWHSHDFMAYGGCGDFANPAMATDPGSLPYCHGNWISRVNYARIAQALYCADPMTLDEEDNATCQGGIHPFASVFLGQPPARADQPTGALQSASVGRAPPLEPRIASAGVTQEGEYLFVSGRVWPDGTVELHPFYRRSFVTPPSDRSGGGEFRLTLEDAEGNVLVSHDFQPREVAEAPRHAPAMMREVIPWHEATSRVVVRRGPQVLAEREVSSAAPSITVFTPNGGEQLGAEGEVMVSWASEDADGDPMSYWVEYSPDEGASWTTLWRNTQETSLTVNLANLAPSSRALIRVLASDGINTTADTSDGVFAVASKAPWVGIAEPRPGELPGGSGIRFTGFATDYEDGVMTGEALVWESDVDGVLGRGETFIGRLTSGRHVVTLTATDRDGMRGSGRIEVIVP